MSLTEAPRVRKSSMGKTAFAVGIGNFMEWFDFAVYGYFAAVVGALFFASDDPMIGLLSSLSVFAVGFVMRPLGGLIFGPIGDRKGRKFALVLSVLLMGVATTLIGCLPTFHDIGVTATVLLVALRMVQGLSAGGEGASAITFLIESAPKNRRGLVGSVIPASAALSFVAGSFAALLVNSLLGETEMLAWGWRIPFLIAAPLSIIGLYVRLRIEESPVFEALVEKDELATSPLKLPLVNGWRSPLVAFAVSAVGGTGIYFLATYMNTQLSTVAGFPKTTALTLMTVALISYMALCPLAGWLADRFGRRPINLLGTIGHLVLTIPVFLLVGSGSQAAALLGLVLMAISQSMVVVTNFVIIVELFPAASRSSSVSLAYNLALAFVAGPGPFVAAWLFTSTGNPLSPAFYLIGVAAVCLPILLAWLPETLGRNLFRSHSIEETAPLEMVSEK